MDEKANKEAFDRKIKLEEENLLREENLERERLAKLEQLLIKQMKERLLSILNERAQVGDVRESDVKESEIIDIEVEEAIAQKV